MAIEVGRFHNISEEQRLCEMCDLSEVENELHFMLHCTKYDELRQVMFSHASKKDPEFFWYTDYQKVEWLFNFDIFGCANFISKAWQIRQALLFN